MSFRGWEEGGCESDQERAVERSREAHLSFGNPNIPEEIAGILTLEIFKVSEAVLRTLRTADCS